MRIVLVTNGLRYGGAERVVEALAEGLSARGDAVCVVATTRDGPVGDALRKRGIPVSILSIRSAFDARVPLELARIARRFGAEIIHSHLAVSDLATVLARTFLPGVRIVSTIHSGYLDLSKTTARLWRLSLRRFDRLIAVSAPVRSLLPEDLDVTILRPSLIETSELEASLSREDARARLGIASETPLVMAVGRLVSVKGFDVLAEAARRLRIRGVRVLVIGEGPEAEALGKERSIELIGSDADAARLLSAADVVVSASRSEGFPQTPLHAMAAGVPVVATAVGGTPEIVIDQKTGLLVPPDDPHALACALERVLGDPAWARRLGEAGRARLQEEGYTKRAMIDRTRAIYEAIR